MKKSTHSKIKNTAILFELLTRQVAADTIKGVENSPALGIIKEYFKSNSVLAKELVLYQTLINEKYNSNEKAAYLVNTVVKLRNKMNAENLNTKKYELIREVKKHYDLKAFFKTNLSEYKLYASIYRIFEGANVAKVGDMVKSRYTVLEHITKKSQNRLDEAATAVVDDYLRQDEEVRLLAYKLMIDKFNDKYANLSIKQKSILKEYINNVSNTEALKQFLVTEANLVAGLIRKVLPTVTDKVTSIKLKEVITLTGRLQRVKTIKEEHVLSLLLYHELLKELKNVK